MAAETEGMNRSIGKAGIKVHIAMPYAYPMKCDNIDLLFRGAVGTGEKFSGQMHYQCAVKTGNSFILSSSFFIPTPVLHFNDCCCEKC